MLSKTLNNVINEFIHSMNATAKVRAEQVAELRAETMYSEDYKNEQEKKIREAVGMAMSELRKQTEEKIKSLIDNGMATVENSVDEGAHDTIFEEIKNAAEATGGDFTEFEITMLLKKCNGHYWAMRLLSRLTKDGTNAANILKERFKMPEPEYYLELLTEEKNYLLSFVQTYKDDTAAIIDIARSDVNGETLLSGGHFETLHERIMVNPDYLTDDDLEVPALRAFERQRLRESGIKLDLNDIESKKLVREAARIGGPVRNLLVRTCWKPVIDEETKRMWEDACDNAKIKYGTAGKTAFESFGNRMIY